MEDCVHRQYVSRAFSRISTLQAVFLGPNKEDWRLVLLQIGLAFGLARNIVAIVVEQAELQFMPSRPRQALVIQ